MVPKKASTHIKPTAEEMKVTENLVEDVVSFYWSNVRTSLVDLEEPNINIDALGIFKIKTWKIEEVRNKYQVMIDAYKKRADIYRLGFQRFAIMKDLERWVIKINNVQKLIDEETLKKNNIKLKRNEQTAEKHNKDLEK